mgnify:CR=1 FL=1
MINRVLLPKEQFSSSVTNSRYELPKEVEELFGKILLLKKTLKLSGTIYSKYIIKNNKRYGPYWYEKKNDKDRYLGKNLPVDYQLSAKNKFLFKRIQELQRRYDRIKELQYKLEREILAFCNEVYSIIEHEVKEDE